MASRFNTNVGRLMHLLLDPAGGLFIQSKSRVTETRIGQFEQTIVFLVADVRYPAIVPAFGAPNPLHSFLTKETSDFTKSGQCPGIGKLSCTYRGQPTGLSSHVQIQDTYATSSINIPFLYDSGAKTNTRNLTYRGLNREWSYVSAIRPKGPTYFAAGDAGPLISLGISGGGVVLTPTGYANIYAPGDILRMVGNDYYVVTQDHSATSFKVAATPEGTPVNVVAIIGGVGFSDTRPNLIKIDDTTFTLPYTYNDTVTGLTRTFTDQWVVGSINVQEFGELFEVRETGVYQIVETISV